MPNGSGQIVVGVAGSEGSVAALRWAAEEARTRGWRLHIVHAWQYVESVPLPGLPAPYLPPHGDYQRAASAVLDAAVSEAGLADSDLVASTEAVHDNAAAALLEAATDAELLVVGARSHGGLLGVLFGSTADECAHRAPCPVVVVPAPNGRRAPGDRAETGP